MYMKHLQLHLFYIKMNTYNEYCLDSSTTEVNKSSNRKYMIVTAESARLFVRAFVTRTTAMYDVS